MGYCDLDDVKRLNSKRARDLTATSIPSEADILVFIDQIADEINATLISIGAELPEIGSLYWSSMPFSLGYFTPSNLYGYLRNLNIFGAAALWEASLVMDGKKESIDPRDWRWNNIYTKRLNDLLKNPKIAGATMPASAAGSRSNVTSGTTNANARFKSSVDPW